jgi:putative NADPH-quinone reductase
MESDVDMSALTDGAPVCLIVRAHPLHESLNGTLGAHLRARAEARGWQVLVRDLYASDFAPALTAAERASYQSGTFDQTGVAAEAAELARAEILILVFPTWWFGFPAVLKGWFDRVWAPGVAFDQAPGHGAIRPRLARLRHVLAVTTLGSPWWVDWLALHRPLPRILRRAVVGLCAPRARCRTLSLYQAEVVDGARVARFLARIDRALSAVR